jgi:hypothetical protein
MLASSLPDEWDHCPGLIREGERRILYPHYSCAPAKGRTACSSKSKLFLLTKKPEEGKWRQIPPFQITFTSDFLIGFNAFEQKPTFQLLS